MGSSTTQLFETLQSRACEQTVVLVSMDAAEAVMLGGSDDGFGGSCNVGGLWLKEKTKN